MPRKPADIRDPAIIVEAIEKTGLEKTPLAKRLDVHKNSIDRWVVTGKISESKWKLLQRIVAEENGEIPSRQKLNLSKVGTTELIAELKNRGATQIIF